MSLSIAGELQNLKKRGIFRSTRVIAGRQSSKVVVEGVELLMTLLQQLPGACRPSGTDRGFCLSA